jgi:hypothetical protein
MIISSLSKVSPSDNHGQHIYSISFQHFCYLISRWILENSSMLSSHSYF